MRVIVSCVSSSVPYFGHGRSTRAENSEVVMKKSYEKPEVVKFGSVEQITELLLYDGGNNLPPTLTLIVK
jgi:hypothetical protein